MVEGKRVQFDSATKKVLFNNSTKKVMFYDCVCADCEPDPGTPAKMTIEISGFSDVACYDHPTAGSLEPYGDISSNFNGTHVLTQRGYVGGIEGWACCVWYKDWPAPANVGYKYYTSNDCGTGYVDDNDFSDLRIWFDRTGKWVSLLYSQDGITYYSAYLCQFDDTSPPECNLFNESIDSDTPKLIDGGSFAGCDGNYPGGCP